MHGIIFSELRKYVEAKTGDKGWDALMAKAGLSTKLYTSFGNYPDAEVAALVAAAAEISGRPANAILEDSASSLRRRWWPCTRTCWTAPGRRWM